MQHLPAPRNPRHHRSDGNVHDPGNLRVAEFLDVAQPDGLPERLGEVVQCCLQICVERRPGQQLLRVVLRAATGAGRFRLFQPRTGKTVGKAGDFFGASFWGGMYHDQYVLEDGIWRIWELTLDEPYINPVAWNDGVWAKSKDPVKPPCDSRCECRTEGSTGSFDFGAARPRSG